MYPPGGAYAHTNIHVNPASQDWYGKMPDLHALIRTGRRRRAHPALPLLLGALFGLLSCAPEEISGEAQVALRWNFVDGRNCDTGGIGLVLILAEGIDPLVSSCSTGFTGAFPLGALPAGPKTFQVEAQSPAGAALYKGEITATLEAGQTHEFVVPLFFTGGL